MKYLICIIVGCWLLMTSAAAFPATARCKVIRKQGNVLVMDCGSQAAGFKEKSKVKIKTDRDK